MDSKSKKHNIPKSVNEMSKEMLEKTLKKKKECNAKALEIVEKMCESCVDEDWFLENLQFINQSHFEDVTIERSISHLCGYPLCDKQLKNVPSQQYHISTRYNKVFDITERKNFCSNHCYAAVIYVKKQLFTSPLWFRDQEVIPKFKILKSSISEMGEEIVLLPDKIKLEPEDTVKANESKKVNIVDQNMEELEEKYTNLKIDKKIKNKELKCDKDTNNCCEIEEKDLNIKIVEKANYVKDGKEKTDSNKHVKTDDDKDSKRNIISVENQLKNAEKTEKKSVSKNKVLDAIQKVEKSVIEWFSLETYFHLFGENKLKELYSDKADEIKQVLNSKLSMASHRDKIDRMIQLYGLLDSGSFSNKEVKTNLKPLPDYTALKEEKNTVEIKVKAFYQGQLEVKETPAKDKEEKKEEKNENADPEVIYLPLVDAHAQIPHRRKILLDKLNRILPSLIKIFSMDYILQMNEVRHLVATFTLSAHNIIFKPTEWHLVGILILKLLSIKDKQLESVMKNESSESQMSLILENYNLEKNYFDNLVVRLTDSENLVKKLDEINS